jgi:hypothetical protein
MILPVAAITGVGSVEAEPALTILQILEIFNGPVHPVIGHFFKKI